MQKSKSSNGILICLVGPAGVGKSTIAQHLIASDPNLAVSISLTSRQPRPGEVDGTSYHFVSTEEFQESVKNNELFEYEEVHGNLYGTPKKEILSSLDIGRDLLLDIDFKGALNIKKQLPTNCIICFLLPPDRHEMIRRIETRSQISKEELATRLATAQKELDFLKTELSTKTKHKSAIDYVVVNYGLEESIQTFKSIIRAERHRSSRACPSTISKLVET